MEHTMTIKEVLEDVKATLDNLMIPMPEVNTIGIPVARAIEGIRICIEAIAKGEEEAAKREAEKQEGEKDA